MSNNTDLKEKEISKALQDALKFRNDRDKVQQSIDDADAYISKLKKMIDKKEEQKKKAKKCLRKYQNEDKLIKAIALIPSPETEKKNRVYYSTQGFFNLLNMFNPKDKKEFSDMYNSLKDTKTLARIVLESANYGIFKNNPLDPENDYVVIHGKSLRQRINEELEKQKSNIEQAKIKLDEEYNKNINKANPEKEKPSDPPSSNDDKSEDNKQ